MLVVYDKIDNHFIDVCCDEKEGLEKIEDAEALDRMDNVYKPNRYELREDI